MQEGAPALAPARASVPAPSRERRLHAVEPAHVAVVGLGYVGLPTSLALTGAGRGVLGIDISESRLDAIRGLDVDLVASDRKRLEEALANPRFRLSAELAELADADVVLICVPTPVHADLAPDLRPLRAACAAVVAHARRGQTIVLTSTSYVGTTRQLLVEPLAVRGLLAGTDVCVAFSPERIDPGNTRHGQASVPRVIGGATHGCALATATVLAGIASDVHIVSSPEAAEMTKLLENTFRAVNVALAHELAEVAIGFGLSPVEIVDAAATKPYGFLPFYPSAGVGGHCIPCDPHYLLKGVEEVGGSAPLVRLAMQAIADRPGDVGDRVADLLDARGEQLDGAETLVVGAAYKPGIRDVRESPACKILAELRARGARVAYHDPLVPELVLDGEALRSVPDPGARTWDLVIVACVHPDADLGWLDDCELVVDCTFRTPGGRTRAVI